jgi:FkbM family methyltransferase
MHHSILHTAGNVVWVAQHDARDAVALLSTYYRLKLQELLAPRRGSAAVKRTRILDTDVGFFDYYWLVEMYEEIFLRKHYYFESKNPSPVIIDVGSNIGLAIVFFKRLFPRAKVLAFEPDPETFDVLARNVSENQLDGIRLRNEAVYDGRESVFLYCDRGTPGSPQQSLRSERVAGAKKAVPATRLSQHVTGPVDFLKVDIEGAERVVIDDLERNGKLTLVKRMAIEYHHHLDTDEDSLAGLLAVLERNRFGYQLEARLPGSAGAHQRHYQNVLIHAYTKEAHSSASSQGR